MTSSAKKGRKNAEYRPDPHFCVKRKKTSDVESRSLFHPTKKEGEPSACSLAKKTFRKSGGKEGRRCALTADFQGKVRGGLCGGRSPAFPVAREKKERKGEWAP